ncbi:MAG: hypothetical protein ABI888_02390 [Chloroflexota bacterium]
MNDDRLLSALRRLGQQELPVATDRTIRGRLETAWTTRSSRAVRPSFSVRRFAPVLAAFALVAGLGVTVLGARADSPLWDTRIALESAGAYLRLSTDDRVAYLLELVQSRTEEAARQEVLGNSAAAAKARAAASSAIVQLGGDIPHIETTLPTPVVSSATPAPANSPSPSPTRSASSVPAAQLPTPTPTRTNSPVAATEPVHTASPSPVRTQTPAPTATKTTVTITGVVRDSAGANVTGACVTTSPSIPTSTSSCITKTTNGTYAFSVQTTTGQAITLYAYLTTSTGTLAGSSSSTVAAPYTLMPAITLTPRR